MSRSKKGKSAPSNSEARIQFDPKVMAALVPGPLTVAEANAVALRLVLRVGHCGGARVIDERRDRARVGPGVEEAVERVELRGPSRQPCIAGK